MFAPEAALLDLRPAEPWDTTARPFPVARLTASELVETPHGACFRLERRYPLAELAPEPARLAALTTGRSLSRASGLDWPHEFAWERAAFLDIETTGLGGGAGTYVIMVGLGWWEGGELVVEQLFLQELAAERALLHRTLERLAGASGLVSFNGRAFDLPLLLGRFALARVRNDLDLIDHLDLLLLARRLFRPRLGSCALGALEQNLLGLRRGDDVPGWLIPSLYYDYLRRGDPSQLAGIFDHNARDVAALARLADACGGLLDGPAEAEDLFALAGVYLTAGEADAAIAQIQRALTADLPLERRARALYNLASAYKRLGRWSEAEATWLQILAERGTDKLAATLELAKYYEHRRRDFRSAFRLALTAETQLVLALPADHPQRQEILRRTERLRRKVARLGEPA